VRPANFHTTKLAPAPIGYLYHVATNGFSTMLGYKAQVPVRDRWAIAAWVRTLQVSQRAAEADVPANNKNAAVWRVR
jgi:hypothetical protein